MGWPTTITSSAFHEPPIAPYGKSHTVRGAPPRTSIRLSSPAPANATDWLSGDQNMGGVRPPSAASVPERGRATSASIRRTHRRVTPSDPVPANTNCWPSGDTANGDASDN